MVCHTHCVLHSLIDILLARTQVICNGMAKIGILKITNLLKYVYHGPLIHSKDYTICLHCNSFEI